MVAKYATMIILGDHMVLFVINEKLVTIINNLESFNLSHNLEH